MYRRTVHAQLNIAKHTYALHPFRGPPQSEGRLFILFSLPFNSLSDTQYSGGEKERKKKRRRFTHINPVGCVDAYAARGSNGRRVLVLI